MKSFIISAIAVLASFTAASPIVKRSDPIVFRLKPGPDAPAKVASLGSLKWDGTSGGNLGWFPTTNPAPKDATLFIQFNAKNGIAFYSRGTSNQVYYRPTHGTPMYFVKLGNPAQDSVPELTLSDNFTLDSPEGSYGPEYFGYNHNYSGAFVACGADGSYTLYNGPGAGGAGCTENFSLVTEYV